MISEPVLPTRTDDPQADYDALLYMLRAWVRTANELDKQVHALREETAHLRALSASV